MTTEEDVLAWICILFVTGLIGFAIAHYLNPKNRLSRALEAFWNTPRVAQIRRDIWRGFLFIVLLWLTAQSVNYYFNESSWYPREREVEVFFKPHQWIDGEIKTCYSDQTKKTTDGELISISCGFEQDESHVLRVKFYGPIKAEKNKLWKCERSQTGMTCRLQ
jgi:hypothetical protein